jgi:lysine-N-methylase
MKVTMPACFAKFHCTGGDCIDTCCQRWVVKVDRRHYEATKARVAEDRAEAAVFSRFVRLNSGAAASDKNFAIITMGEDGKCPMLDAEGLCLIHRKYGAEYLWDTCRIYPRVISKYGDEIEVTGAPSCPEVMRLCLTEQNPYALIPLPEEQGLNLQGLVVNREIVAADDLYAAGFKQVRQVLLAIIADEQRALNGRLFQLATAANEMTDFYFRRCPGFDWQRLSHVLAAVVSEECQQACDHAMQEYQSAEPLALIVALSALEIFRQQDASALSSQLYSAIMVAHPEAKGEGFSDAGYFANAIRSRRGSIPKEHLLRLDRGVGRYVGNCLLREWFTDMPDVLTYLQMLLARCAIVRFLLLMHPMLPDLGSEDEVDALLVSVIYAFSRDIDHSQQFLEVLYKALAEQQMLDYAYSAAFIAL